MKNDTPSDQKQSFRKSSWKKKLFYLSPFWLLLFIYMCFEIFVDPYSHSLWALRVLNTKYLVKVHVELTVDNKPLVMDRTFRCFSPVDYHFFPGSSPRGTVLASNGQAGDTLTAETDTGRLFIVNANDACAVILQKAGSYGAKPVNIPALYLTKGDLDIPLVRELFINEQPMRVDTYIVPHWLIHGYQGVQLDEVRVEMTSGILWKDWSEYESFGPLNWARLPYNMGGIFTARYGFIIPETDWDEVDKFYVSWNTQDKEALSRLIRDIQKISFDKQPYKLPYNNLFNRLNTIFYNSVDWAQPEKTTLRLPSVLERGRMAEVKWFLEQLYPCVSHVAKKAAYVCDPSRRGVISAQYYVAGDTMTPEFEVEGFRLKTEKSGGGYYLAAPPLRVIVFDSSSPGFIKGINYGQ